MPATAAADDASKASPDGAADAELVMLPFEDAIVPGQRIIVVLADSSSEKAIIGPNLQESVEVHPGFFVGYDDGDLRMVDEATLRGNYEAGQIALLSAEDSGAMSDEGGKQRALDFVTCGQGNRKGAVAVLCAVEPMHKLGGVPLYDGMFMDAAALNATKGARKSRLTTGENEERQGLFTFRAGDVVAYHPASKFALEAVVWRVGQYKHGRQARRVLVLYDKKTGDFYLSSPPCWRRVPRDGVKESDFDFENNGQVRTCSEEDLSRMAETFSAWSASCDIDSVHKVQRRASSELPPAIKKAHKLFPREGSPRKSSSSKPAKVIETNYGRNQQPPRASGAAQRSQPTRGAASSSSTTQRPPQRQRPVRQAAATANAEHAAGDGSDAADEGGAASAGSRGEANARLDAAAAARAEAEAKAAEAEAARSAAKARAAQAAAAKAEAEAKAAEAEAEKAKSKAKAAKELAASSDGSDSGRKAAKKKKEGKKAARKPARKPASSSSSSDRDSDAREKKKRKKSKRKKKARKRRRLEAEEQWSADKRRKKRRGQIAELQSDSSST